MQLYNSFFKAFVLRKKTEITNPHFFYLGEVKLPINSLLLYTPNNLEELGPSIVEPLISNFDGEVNIGFDSLYTPVLGRTLNEVFDEKKKILLYRKNHYKYNYTRNVSAAISRKNELFVMNNALGHFKYRYQIDRFLSFYRNYNQLNTTVTLLNKMADEYRERNIFFRIELPPVIPSYLHLNEAGRKYTKCLDSENIPRNINDQGVDLLKPYASFWLLDWLFLLQGEKDKSLFGKLNERCLEKLNLVFSYEGRCVIIKPKLLLEWLDETSSQKEVLTSSRINAIKRILLVFVTLIKSTVNKGDVGEKAEETIKKDGVTNSSSEDNKVGEIQRTDKGDANTVRVPEEFPDTVEKSTSRDTSGNTNEQIPNSDVKGGGGEVHSEVHGNTTEINWTDEVDDKEFETERVVEETTLKLKDRGKDYGILKQLEIKAKGEGLTVTERDYFIKMANSYKEITLPNGQTLENFVESVPEDIVIKEEATDTEIVGVSSPSMLKSRTDSFKKDYAEKLLLKDVCKSVLSIQNAGVALTDLKLDVESNITGSFYVLSMKLHPVNGSPSTRVMRIPVIDSNGYYKVDGQTRVKNAQRIDIPVRKLDEYRVGLTSHYGCKIVISRNRLNVNDRWLKISKEIKIKGMTPNSGLKYYAINCFNSEMKLPRPFTQLSKYFRSIDFGNYKFNFDIKDFIKLKANINENKCPCGYQGEEMIYLDLYGNVLKGNNVNLGPIENILKLDVKKLPIDFGQVNVRGTQFPLGVILSYYFGFDTLLKKLKTVKRTINVGERLLLGDGEFALSFADEHLILNAKDPMTSLVFGGMAKLSGLSNFNRSDLNKPGIWPSVMNNDRVRPNHFNEMSLLRDMFIDPVTAELLEDMGYTPIFEELLIEATKLLIWDNHRHEVEIEEQRLICYEAFTSVLYSELVNTVRQFRNKPNDKRNTIDINPEAVLVRITTDTATDLKDDANPIHEIKEQEVVTFGGIGGRKEISMVKHTRGHLNSYSGIISEAGKDSGKVGYVSYLTSNAKIKDLRGRIDSKLDVGETGLGSVIMNLMYGSTIDDQQNRSKLLWVRLLGDW